MVWDKTKPENDMLLINFPAACRANWDALELGTDPTLQITNDKVAPNAGIVDTKLAQITSANKVHGSAMTGFASVPQAAGVLPADNSPNKLKADASDTTPEYLDALIDTAVFQVSAGDQLQLKDGGVQTQKIEGGAASPGNTKYYGTNGIGTKGFFDLPEATDERVKGSSGDSLAGYLDAKVDNTTIEVSSNQLRIKNSSISTAKLKTSIGEVSASSYSINHLTLPGGEYGFFPQTRASSTATGRHAVSVLGTVGIDGVSIGTSYVTRCMIRAEGVTIYAQQRYVTSSGKDYWLFLLVDKVTKNVIAAWGAHDHPSYGNGGDPLAVPHPFLSYDPAAQDVLLVEKDNTGQLLREAGDRGKSLLTLIGEDYTVDWLSSAQYIPLHSGKFLGYEPELIQTIPAYIQVKKLRLMTSAEKMAKQDKLAQERLDRDQEKAKQESDKLSARAKLKGLGLTDDELKAVGVA